MDAFDPNAVSDGEISEGEFGPSRDHKRKRKSSLGNFFSTEEGRNAMRDAMRHPSDYCNCDNPEFVSQMRKLFAIFMSEAFPNGQLAGIPNVQGTRDIVHDERGFKTVKIRNEMTLEKKDWNTGETRTEIVCYTHAHRDINKPNQQQSHPQHQQQQHQTTRVNAGRGFGRSSAYANAHPLNGKYVSD